MNQVIRLLLVYSITASFADAAIYLTVTGAKVKKANLMVGKVHWTAPSVLSEKLDQEVAKDLRFLNLFDFADQSITQSLDKPNAHKELDFEEASKLNLAFALKMSSWIEGPQLFLEAVLFDVAGKKRILASRYQYPVVQFPRLVHAMSEDILKELTGERGLFYSRILMSCKELGGKSSAANKEIYVVDPDARNFTQVTSDKTLSLSPAWAGNGQWISYTQYEFIRRGRISKRGTVLKRHNIRSGERKYISARDGMNSGASWSPDGETIAATLSYAGRPEIFLFPGSGMGEPTPLSRQILWRKLSGEGFQPTSVEQLFDVEPDWSPNGKEIVFSSARTGHPMIYIVNVASHEARQLTFAGQYNASPSWSPRGDKIIFAAQRTGEGNFDLYGIDPDGNNLERLTSGDAPGRRFNNENASWAPTGRHFTYASNEGGRYRVYVRTLDGRESWPISPPNRECMTPAWSPFEG